MLLVLVMVMSLLMRMVVRPNRVYPSFVPFLGDDGTGRRERAHHCTHARRSRSRSPILCGYDTVIISDAVGGAKRESDLSTWLSTSEVGPVTAFIQTAHGCNAKALRGS